MHAREFPHALARKWVADFAEHLCLVLALRELKRRKAESGVLRGALTTRAVALLETADQLAAYGLHPSYGVSGSEGQLWALTIRYAADVPWLTPPGGVPVEDLEADIGLAQRAWNQFETDVTELPDDLCESSAVLSAGRARGTALERLFGYRGDPGVVPVAIIQDRGQSASWSGSD